MDRESLSAVKEQSGMKQRIAVVGTGIAGMSAAWWLHQDHDITVFEAEQRIGGHTNTAFIQEGEKTVPVDTGFIVCNEQNYPLLMKLFRHLDVPLKPTSMSFSVRHLADDLEYCGSSLELLFVQRRNLFSWRYLRFLRQVQRFNEECTEVLQDQSLHDLSIAEYAASKGLGRDFLHWYILPMSSALWSTPYHVTLDFPVLSLVRFFHNHGLLGLHTQYQWYTVEGGSEVYKQKLIAPFKDRIHTGLGVTGVLELDAGAELKLSDGSSRVFDKVILATHADQALRLLQQPTELQRNLLLPFQYQVNDTILHTDPALMPLRKRAWSSWNYRVEKADGSGGSCTYWMNSLQGVSDTTNYFVTLNGRAKIDPEKILRSYSYEHPVFTTGAMKAQEQLPLLNSRGSILFCGSYFGNGFHEDAIRSAKDAVQQIVDIKW